MRMFLSGENIAVASEIQFVRGTASEMLFVAAEKSGITVKPVLEINFCGFFTGSDRLLGKGKPLGQNVLLGRDLHIANKLMVHIAFGNEECIADFFDTG